MTIENKLSPNIDKGDLTREVSAIDHRGQIISMSVIEERPLTIFLNSQEIVTAMFIGDYPDYLAIGFLRNQGMLLDEDEIIGISYDEEIETVVVRTKRITDYEEKLQKKIRTSGCAIGTVFGDIMSGISKVKLPDIRLKTSDLYAVSKKINQMPSLYLKVGAIHGTVLCKEDKPLIYMEDVGRHNAVDKVAGYMFQHDIKPDDKYLYTTGRLTSEMVIKTALMGIPILVSRSGFTAWGVEIAKNTGLTLIGRLRGERFMCLNGAERLVWDKDDET